MLILAETTSTQSPNPSPSLPPSLPRPPSQGVGYGLILALYSNDQEYFSMQLDNAEKYMWNDRQ